MSGGRWGMEAGMEAGRARGLRRESEFGHWFRRRVLVALELVLLVVPREG